jgi:predicted PurR-regulated permease PerM
MPGPGDDRRGQGGWALAAIAGALGIVYLVVRYFSPLVTTLVAGGAVYYTLAPVCAWLARRRVPRWVSVPAIALLLGASVAVALMTLVPRVYSELEELTGSLPLQLARVERRLSEAGLLGEGANPRVLLATESLIERAGGLVSTGLQRIFGLAASAFGSVTAVILGLCFGFYLLFGAADLARGLASWVPPDDRDRWTRFGREASWAAGGYVRARVLAALFIGTSYAVAFAVLGLEEPLLLGVVGGLFDLVPVVGPLLAAVPALIVAAFHGFGKVLAVVAVMLVAQQVESGVLDPLLAGRMVRISPAVMVLVIAAGSAAAGIPGMLVAVPLAAATRAALAIFYRERWEGPPA